MQSEKLTLTTDSWTETYINTSLLKNLANVLSTATERWELNGKESAQAHANEHTVYLCKHTNIETCKDLKKQKNNNNKKKA